MGERYYDPTIGRFTQLDLMGEGYVYAEDNPVNFVDPSGLASVPDDPLYKGGDPKAGSSEEKPSDDKARTRTRAATQWGKVVRDFERSRAIWTRVSVHAEGARDRAYRGATSIEEVWRKGNTYLYHHVIYRDGKVLHETFRPYPKG